MANIKIVVNGPLMDGHKLTFKAPCDCISVEKLKVCYVENATQKNRLFTMKDAHGNDLTGLGNLFSQGAYVDVVLDTVNGFAYLQNAGTNKYLEQKLTPVDNLESDRSDLPLSARMGSELNKNLGGLRFGVDGEGNGGYFKADDSFIPFSGKLGKIGEFSITSRNVVIDDIGFKPSIILGYEKNNTGLMCSKGLPTNKSLVIWRNDAAETASECNFTVTDNGFSMTLKSNRLTYYNNTNWYYIALK